MKHHEKPAYDAFNYNNGIPPEANTRWNSVSRAWEWTDLTINPVDIPENFPSEIKQALAHNICIVCGEKNCPYIRNFNGYQMLISALQRGDKNTARRIYNITFAPVRGTNQSAVEAGLEKAHNAREKLRIEPAMASPNITPPTRLDAWAPPLFWGPWVPLKQYTGGSAYTVSFDTISSAPSTFSVQIHYSSPDGRSKVIDAIGPGSFLIENSSSGNTDKIRFRSHSLGQHIRVEYR